MIATFAARKLSSSPTKVRTRLVTLVQYFIQKLYLISDIDISNEKYAITAGENEIAELLSTNDDKFLPSLEADLT